MNHRLITALSLGVTIAGASSLSARQIVDGQCVFTATFTESCITGDPIPACVAKVATECHDTHWKVTLATCHGSSSTITCTASWVDD